MSELLSIEALNWLKECNYREKSHDERMTLIAAAKIAYPSDNEEKEFLNNINLSH